MKNEYTTLDEAFKDMGQMTAMPEWRTPTVDEVLADAVAELNRARAKFPDWQQDPVHGAAVAAEEAGEVTKAVNNFYWSHGADQPADIYGEVVQAIAMYLRFAVDSEWMEIKQEAA